MHTPMINSITQNSLYSDYTKFGKYENNKNNFVSKIDTGALEILSVYNKHNINFKQMSLQKAIITKDMVNSYRVPNLNVVENCGLRGETLSSRKNRWFLDKLKMLGVTDVIDLRDMYSSEQYPEMCQTAGVKYHSIPIDSFRIDTRKIIDKMPELFNILDNKNYYIACALGLHRTDIALAINYFFNPLEHEVPTMYGHQRITMRPCRH